MLTAGASVPGLARGRSRSAIGRSPAAAVNGWGSGFWGVTAEVSCIVVLARGWRRHGQGGPCKLVGRNATRVPKSRLTPRRPPPMSEAAAAHPPRMGPTVRASLLAARREDEPQVRVRAAAGDLVRDRDRVAVRHDAGLGRAGRERDRPRRLVDPRPARTRRDVERILEV